MDTKKIITRILEDYEGSVPPGLLYYEALINGYEGIQSELLKVANDMVRSRQIIGKRKGISQKVWYELKQSQTLNSLEKIHA